MVVNTRNSLPNWVVSANTTNTFKAKLDKRWHNQYIIYNFMAQLQETGSRREFSYEESYTPFTRYNRLSNRLHNWFDKPVDTTFQSENGKLSCNLKPCLRYNLTGICFYCIGKQHGATTFYHIIFCNHNNGVFTAKKLWLKLVKRLPVITE